MTYIKGLIKINEGIYKQEQDLLKMLVKAEKDYELQETIKRQIERVNKTMETLDA
jgi:HEPN domain-containing protein